jgi:hypothetical protein
VDTAVQPKHQARYVTYPAALAVQRPAPPQRRESRAEQEEAILDGLVGAKQDGAQSDDPSRDVVRLVTRSMWGDRNSAGLRARLLEVVGQMREPSDAA